MRSRYGAVPLLLLIAPLLRGADEPPELLLATPVEGEMRDAPQPWKIVLAAGQYARIVVEQPSADVAVRVAAPDGREVAAVDGMIANAGPEYIALVAEEDGAYTVEVRPTDRPKNRTGRFVVRLDVVRAATETDPPKIAAQRVLAEA